MTTLVTSKSRRASLSFLSRATSVPLALLIAAVALVVLTVTLSTVLDERDRWTEAAAAAGIVAMVVACAVLLGSAQGWANGTKLSLAAVSTAVIGMGALALVVVTYVGGASDVGIGGSNVQNVSDEGAALSQQVSNNAVQPPGYAHDVGEHPTVLQFLEQDNATVLRNVPGGTLLPTEVDTVRGQLSAAREFAIAHNTTEKAEAAGFYNTTNDVPFMGAHFLNSANLTDGVFDPAKPEGLLFSKLDNPDGEWQLVGVWYLLIPGLNPGITDTKPPEGFAGNLDLWHAHYGLCTRAGVISENNTHEGCLADAGRWTGDLRWMMHVWVYPEGMENPEGVFVYLNKALWDVQRLVQAPLQ
ncbi:MAG: hypothetical protein HY723_02755 [Chloroflexi bacterium]|nr:hypothetical protein [Chloroflexota bacterium]